VLQMRLALLSCQSVLQLCYMLRYSVSHILVLVSLEALYCTGAADETCSVVLLVSVAALLYAYIL
jgi:hypothetical protein